MQIVSRPVSGLLPDRQRAVAEAAPAAAPSHLGIAFLWSAVEKLTFPQGFDPFLDRYGFLQMGLDCHIYLLASAFVAFALFYVPITGRNAAIIAAILANILIATVVMSYYGLHWLQCRV